MSDNSFWMRSAVQAVLIAVAAVSYYLAQTAINKRATELPVLTYLNCLNKAGTINWDKYGNPATHPSASEICGELSQLHH